MVCGEANDFWIIANNYKNGGKKETMKKKHFVFYPDKFNLMTSHMKTGIMPAALLFIFISAHAQSPTYNQNNARSNHAKMMSPGFDFRLTPQYGVSLNDADDSLFFSGNGTGFKMDAGYSFGNFGIGISSGFISAPTDKTKINEFLLKTGAPLDQLLISTGHQQNAYFLLGPTASFGEKIQTSLHAQGGLFINNGGYINVLWIIN